MNYNKSYDNGNSDFSKAHYTVVLVQLYIGLILLSTT